MQYYGGSDVGVRGRSYGGGYCISRTDISRVAKVHDALSELLQGSPVASRAVPRPNQTTL
jgi:hypothetical protein